MTHLFHLSFVQLFFFFSSVGHGEQNEVDLCVYISVVPPPYCGIDVALWGLGLKRHREVDRRGRG